jgi:anti-sigma regulatory factor (Ser/Thr protein kinase)
MTESRILRESNRIVFHGAFGLGDLLRALAMLHHAVHNAGHHDLILDFSGCTAAFAPPMLAICAQIMRLKASRIDVRLIEPKDPKLARLFRNANWAHFLEPRKNDPSEFKGHTQVPAMQFTNAEEQQRAVNRIVNAILGAVPDLQRKELAALEWSINEITDNVLVHSQSNIGGLVQVSTFQKTRKRVEYIVADAGVGIPATLRDANPALSDAELLEQAIKEGVTRDKSVGQGNGLFGSYQICSLSNGFFQVESGRAKLLFTDRDGLQIRAEKIPYDGTLVAAQIDFSVPELLANALRFGGKPYSPVDFIETHYEQQDSPDLLIAMYNESTSFGSRVAGTPIRKKLANLARMCPGQRIIIDFGNVTLVSSSFADEVIGKLFAEFGPLAFMQRFELRNVDATVRQLIDRAISQRMSIGGTKDS